MGRDLKVNKARPREEKGSGSFGGGNGGNRGNYSGGRGRY
jgi:hypothetical protein